MGTRRKSRELALQMLFQADLGQQLPEDVRKTFWKGRGDVGGEVQGFAEDIFRVAQDRSADIDKLIESPCRELAHGPHGRGRSQYHARRRCRIAGISQDPPRVIINEAIEIARKFSAPESAQFINGVLDSVGKEIEGQEPDRVPAKSTS